MEQQVTIISSKASKKDRFKELFKFRETIDKFV